MSERYLQLGISIVCIILFFIANRIIKTVVTKQSKRYDLSEARATYTRKVLNLLGLTLLIILLSVVWEFTIKNIFLFFGTFFSIVGLAFFASWSILSNITASIILFFYSPVKVGNRIRVYDGDNSIEGEIVNISLFNILIRTEEGSIIFYPNNLAIQKPITQKIQNNSLDTDEDLRSGAAGEPGG